MAKYKVTITVNITREVEADIPIMAMGRLEDAISRALPKISEIDRDFFTSERADLLEG